MKPAKLKIGQLSVSTGDLSATGNVANKEKTTTPYCSLANLATSQSQQDVNMALEEISAQLKKLDLLENIQSDIKEIKVNVAALSTKVERLETGQRDLEQAAANMEDDIEEVKASLQAKADSIELDQMRKQIEMLENSARKNNILLLNVSENCELEPDFGNCTNFATYVITEWLQLPNVIIEKANRIGQRKENSIPRPILVTLEKVRDRNIILQKAPRCLKDKSIDGRKVIITDDVCAQTQAKRKRLLPKLMSMKREGVMAFIPHDREPCIRYRDRNGANGTWRTLRESDM